MLRNITSVRPYSSPFSSRWLFVDSPKHMFQISNLRNFFEVLISSTLSFCKLSNKISLNPHILTPVMFASMMDVAEMRRSIASNHMAWRDIMNLMATMDPTRDTALEMVSLALSYQNGNSYLRNDTATGTTHATPSCFSRR